MNIELKLIAESKVRQLGGDVCGVLVRTDSEVMAVSEHGRCTRLDAGVMGPVEPAGRNEQSEIIAELREYFDQRADAEYYTDRDGAVPNEEMQMLAKLDQLQAARAQGGQGANVVAWRDLTIGEVLIPGDRFISEKGRWVELVEEDLVCSNQVTQHTRPSQRKVNTQPQAAMPEGWLVRRVDDRITVQHPDIGGYCASKDGNDHSAIAPVILYHLASALLSTPTTPQPSMPEGKWLITGETLYVRLAKDLSGGPDETFVDIEDGNGNSVRIERFEDGNDWIIGPLYEAPKVLSTPTTPQADGPISGADRVPVKSDGDYEGKIWIFDTSTKQWFRGNYWEFGSPRDSHWMPTGLKRPQPPAGQSESKCCCGETDDAWRLCPEHGPAAGQEGAQ